jgi:hypothetical protein
MLQYFVLLCVDNQDVRRKLPKTVKMVPTMIIPSISKQLVAKEIFDWLYRSRSVKSAQETEPETSQKTNKNPIGFASNEMVGLSDMYAYTSVDITPTRSYVSCSEIDKLSIFTAPEKQAKITKGITDTVIKTIEHKRDTQNQEIKSVIDQQQKNIEYVNHKRLETERIINDIVNKQQNNIAVRQ